MYRKWFIFSSNTALPAAHLFTHFTNIGVLPFVRPGARHWGPSCGQTLTRSLPRGVRQFLKSNFPPPFCRNYHPHSPQSSFLSLSPSKQLIPFLSASGISCFLQLYPCAHHVQQTPLLVFRLNKEFPSSTLLFKPEA